MTAGVDRHELRQIIAGSSEGVILVEPDQTIAYADEAALAMHGAGSLDELGPTIDAYRERFHDVVVGVRRADRPDMDFMHSLRSLVATDRDGNPSCLALSLEVVSDQFEAEEHFDRARRAVRRAANDAADDASDYAGDAYARGGHDLRRATREVSHQVAEFPLASLLIAGAVGF
ncbi:hypothetical protein ACLBXO_28940, partial [Methylobacterium sp. C33D]